jgi:hypothetical protein
MCESDQDSRISEELDPLITSLGYAYYMLIKDM